MAVIVVTSGSSPAYVATHDPVATDAGAHASCGPNAAHWLGHRQSWAATCYSRIVHGARVSLIVGVASTLARLGAGRA